MHKLLLTLREVAMLLHADHCPFVILYITFLETYGACVAASCCHCCCWHVSLLAWWWLSRMILILSSSSLIV